MKFKNKLPITIFIAIILIGISAYHFYNKRQREEIEKKWGVSLIDGATIEKTVHNVTWDNYGRLIYEVDLKSTNDEQRRQMLVDLKMKYNNKDSLIIYSKQFNGRTFVRNTDLDVSKNLKGIQYKVVSEAGPLKIIFYFKEENKLLLFLRTPF